MFGQIAKRSLPQSLSTVPSTAMADWLGRLHPFHRLVQWLRMRRALHQLSSMNEFEQKDLGYPTDTAVREKDERR